jgi:hypothetical protein
VRWRSAFSRIFFGHAENSPIIFGKGSTVPKRQDVSVHMRTGEHLHRAGTAYAVAAVLDDRTVGERMEGEKIWLAASPGTGVMG